MQRARLAFLIAALVSSLFPVVSKADNCSAGFGVFAGIEGFPEVHQQTCKLPGDGEAQIHVTKVRLNEPLAGHLVLRENVPELNVLFGRSEFVDNEVAKELLLIFKDYARKQTFLPEHVSLNFTVTHEANGSRSRSIELQPNLEAANARRLWTLSSSFSSAGTGNTYPISLTTKEAPQRWPSGFKQTYDCLENAVSCTVLWRSLDLSELASVENETAKMLQTIGAELDQLSNGEPNAAARVDEAEWPYDTSRSYQRHFDFCRYLGRGEWPREFLIAISQRDECGGWKAFGYDMPELLVEALLIENKGNRTLAIEGVIGRRDDRVDLRAASETNSPTAPHQDLQWPRFDIAPGTTAIVPLRILFQRNHQLSQQSSQTRAKKMFERIMSKKKGSVFSTDVIDFSSAIPKSMRVRKVRESFLPPEAPSKSTFVFGPAYSIASLSVRAKEIPLRAASLNELKLTYDAAAQENAIDENERVPALSLYVKQETAVSCPILYAWDGDSGEWLNLGKILHQARGPQNEHTEFVNLPRHVRRIRLAEEEPEVSFIKEVTVHLTLVDGRVTIVRPKVDPFRVPAYSYREIDFVLPQEIAEREIATMQIGITGYYITYPAILATRLNARQLGAR